MNKIQKEIYQAPELSKIELNNGLSVLLNFSVDGDVDPIEEGVDESNGNLGRW